MSKIVPPSPAPEKLGFPRVLGAIFLAEFAAFGVFAPVLGFYHDDWWLLELAQDGSLSAAFSSFAGSGVFWTRPVALLFYPLFMTIGGADPFFYHALSLLINVIQGLLLYHIFRGLTGSSRLSLTAAVLSLLVPSRAGTHLWISMTAQNVAMLLVLASLALQTSALMLPRVETQPAPSGPRSGPRYGLILLSQLLFLLGTLLYELFIFLPLLLWAGFAMRLWTQGTSLKKSLLSPARALLPYAAGIGVVLFWQWFGAEHFLKAVNPKSAAVSLSYFFKAMGAGFECVTNRVVHMAWSSFIPLLKAAGPWALLLIPLAAGAAWFLCLPRGRRENDAMARAIALSAAIGGFFAAYAPYALSGSYMPQVYGIMSRSNGAGAVITGLLLAAGLYAIPEKKLWLRRVLLGLVVAAFTWTDWHAGLEWKGAWTLQEDILAHAVPKVSALPQGVLVLLDGAPSFVGHAVAFDAKYDFSAALRLRSGRKDLDAGIFAGRTRYDADAVVELVEGQDGPRHPYATVYIFDYVKDELRRIDGPPPLD